MAVTGEPRLISNYLSAANAVPIYDRRGKLCAIQLTSLADDRGQPGEQHRTSLVTTERCKNQSGEYIGSPLAIKHKLDRSEC